MLAGSESVCEIFLRPLFCSRITSESVVPRTAASAASDMYMTILRRRTGKPAMWPLCLRARRSRGRHWPGFKVRQALPT